MGPEEHVTTYIIVPAAFGVTLAVPSAERAPVHPSPDCPPLAAQAGALDEVQVKATGFPTVMAVGAAVNVTAGRVIATVTVAVALTACATQISP